jgi:anti-anti-sigma factor
MLNIQTRQEEGASIITVKGKINFEVTTDLREEVKETLAAHRPKVLVINMEGVSLIDSSGLGMLVAAKNSVDKVDCRLHLCCIAPQVAKVFDQTNLTNHFSIFAAEQDAMRG